MGDNASLGTRLEAARHRLERLVLESDLAAMPRWKALGLGILRGLYALIREVAEGQLTLRAMSLVYTTLLSFVPLLALSFSVLKGFGAHNAVEPLLLEFLEPLGEQGVDIADNVVGFVDNMRVGALGAVGLIFLVYTVVALVQKIEAAFNTIWRVETQRSLAQRFSSYLSVIMIGPLLVFAALGITATVMSSEAMQAVAGVEPFGRVISELSRLVPYLLIIAAFAFIYMFVPNTRVRLAPALAGAVVAGVLWQSMGWVFANMVAGSTRYDAIYSSFAIMILLLIWIYLAWLILLIGSNVAFYVQHPEYMNVRGRRPRLSAAAHERLGLNLMQVVGRHFVEGRTPPTVDDVAAELYVPGNSLGGAARALEAAGLLRRTEALGLVPGRDLGHLPVAEVLHALREDQEDPALRTLHGDAAVESALEELDVARRHHLGARTMRDLLDRAGVQPAKPAQEDADAGPGPGPSPGSRAGESRPGSGASLAP
ncbi:tRNA-processing RNAse BN [Thioalkalivibrio sp. ALE21]|uniref:YihY/virulence factor BrkB family protein n=1 Tax=Thioalkalivibrio sp. ALE21 TaxID=1158175 RepID=UPI000D9D9D9C|nr:YihY/virulence factor BrkB family protein [Thioalkalivibrio sp. ALE21]PYG02536.1 tRNA-processing RNAse BN [Thioalkalivibrio sp. ALE21]